MFLRLLLAFTGLFFSYAAVCQQGDFLVKPYLQFSTQTGMYVLWETTEPASTQVQFGEARAKVPRAVLDQQAMLPGLRTMHEVHLQELKPETNYFWQVTSVTRQGDTLQSPVYTFKTAVADSSGFMFAFISDTQRNSRTPWAWSKIAEKVWQNRPNFVVHAGDLVDKGLQKTDWTEAFFPDGHVLMSRVPVFTVLGNHEQDSPLYYQYMVAPPPEYFYTFHYGNAQFFMIDTNRDIAEGSEQYEWLEWELAKSKATWKIAMHHHPPYSSDNDDHGNTAHQLSELGSIARNLVPLYEKYHLDFCLYGHIHVYERTWPLRNERIDMHNGIIYVNGGGAGGGLEDFAPTRSWFTQELRVVHHYCTFAIYDNHVVFKAIDHEGNVFDGFQMAKDMEKAQQQARVVQPPAVHLKASAAIFQDQTRISLEAAFEGLEIHYTLDGTEPTRSSPRYQGPFTLSRSATVKTRAYTADGRASRVNTHEFRKMAPQPAARVNKTQPGLRFSYFEGNWEKLPDFGKLKPVKTGIAPSVSLESLGHRPIHFGAVWEGYVEVPVSGTYTFFINSDDGSKLYINGELMIDHDGDHSAIQKNGQTILAAGKHAIRIEYFQGRGGAHLQAGWVDTDMGIFPFAPFRLSH